MPITFLQMSFFVAHCWVWNLLFANLNMLKVRVYIFMLPTTLVFGIK